MSISNNMPKWKEDAPSYWDSGSTLWILSLKLVKNVNVKLNSIEPMFIGQAKGWPEISNFCYIFMEICFIKASVKFYLLDINQHCIVLGLMDCKRFYLLINCK